MSETAKVKPAHMQRAAVIYIRQSHPSQVLNNRESTARQYALVQRAIDLGWPREQISILDEDQGISADGIAKRAGFAQLTADVALLKVGIVLGLEVSRLARNNANWYRLLDLGGITDTLLADADGVYHPALFNDRLVLGLKGTMSEAELHTLRERLNGGIRNKAARGALRRGLPVGLLWGEQEGEVRFHPDEAVISTPSSRASPSWDRPARSGCGFAPRACPSPCRPMGSPTFAGWPPPIWPFIKSCETRCMLAPMCMGKPAASASSMPTARSSSGFAACRARTGPS